VIEDDQLDVQRLSKYPRMTRFNPEKVTIKMCPTGYLKENLP